MLNVILFSSLFRYWACTAKHGPTYNRSMGGFKHSLNPLKTSPEYTRAGVLWEMPCYNKSANHLPTGLNHCRVPRHFQGHLNAPKANWSGSVPQRTLFLHYWGFRMSSNPAAAVAPFGKALYPHCHLSEETSKPSGPVGRRVKHSLMHVKDYPLHYTRAKSLGRNPMWSGQTVKSYGNGCMMSTPYRSP